MTIDLGLFLLRFLLGAVLFVHATQKWWGWFNGPGLDAMSPVFESLGQRPARLTVRVAAVSELMASILVILGVFTIYASALAATTMLVAGAAQSAKSRAVMAARGGGEYPLLLAGVAACLGLTGPGAFSLDASLGAPLDPRLGWWTVCVCIVAPVLAAVPPTVRSGALIARSAARRDA